MRSSVPTVDKWLHIAILLLMVAFQ